MFRFLGALAALALVVSPAALAKPSTAPGFTGPIPANAKVLIVQPDVQLSMLVVAGAEPKADWSQRGTDNLRAALEAMVKTKSHAIFTRVRARAARPPGRTA